MDHIKSLEWRYATKKFDHQKIVPQVKIERLKQAFNLTPTSYGLQPLKLVIVHNKALQQELFPHSAQQQQINTASHVLILCTETLIDNQFIENNFSRIQEIRDTPTKILSPFKDFLLNYFGNQNEEQKQRWATNQVYLAMGNLLNLCAVEGIDACPMEGFDHDKYDEILGLRKQHLKSVLLLPIGYRAEDDIFANFKKVRRPIEEVIIEIN